MKSVKKEELKDILFLITSEDPFCGLEGEEEALLKLIEYLEERGIKVE